MWASSLIIVQPAMLISGRTSFVGMQDDVCPTNLLESFPDFANLTFALYP